MTVPAAEKMTTKIIRTTPVLMELSVCQNLCHAERSDGAISFLSLTACNARSTPTSAFVVKSFAIMGLRAHIPVFDFLGMSHNTHLCKAPIRIHAPPEVCDFNHKGPEIGPEPNLDRGPD